MVTILLIAGIPFDESFWTDVRVRLQEHGHTIKVWTLCKDNGSLSKQRLALASYIETHQIEMVVAHGLAVPLVLETMSHISNPSLRWVLSNGLITLQKGTMQFLYPLFEKIPNPIFQNLLRPPILLPIISSSVGFRRLVINPYVMERSTLKSLSSALNDSTYRRNVCTYVKSLSGFMVPQNIRHCAIDVIWGEIDPLFPLSNIDSLTNTHPTIFERLVKIPGGAHFHPIERPWALADAIHQRTAL